MSGAALARAATALVGTPFRLHGRDPATGLDCIGVLVAALAAIGRRVDGPCGYALRVRDPGQWLPDPAAWGFAPATGPFLPGDAVLLTVGPAQPHLAVRAAHNGWVHAHAGLRRVVLQPCLPAGPILHHWRLAPLT